MKTIITAAFLALGLVASQAYAAGDCAKQADEKKLAGAARNSFVKKCEKDSGGGASAACEKSAADKKLAGAAKSSHIKKCMADSSGAKK